MEAAAAATEPTLRVAAICGSLREDSWHRGLLRAGAQVCEESIPVLDPETREQLKQVLLSLQGFTLRLQKKDYRSN